MRHIDLTDRILKQLQTSQQQDNLLTPITLLDKADT